MELEEWEREVSFEGETLLVTFIKRPFREGLELRTNFRGRQLHLAELGYGEQSALEALFEELRRGTV